MKKKSADLLKLFVIFNLLVVALLSMPEQSSISENPIVRKDQIKNNIAMIADNIKSGQGRSE